MSATQGSAFALMIPNSGGRAVRTNNNESEGDHQLVVLNLSQVMDTLMETLDSRQTDNGPAAKSRKRP